MPALRELGGVLLVVVRHLHLDLRDGRLGTKMEESWCTIFFFMLIMDSKQKLFMKLGELGGASHGCPSSAPESPWWSPGDKNGRSVGTV